jgi:hypothetical protein
MSKPKPKRKTKKARVKVRKLIRVCALAVTSDATDRGWPAAKWKRGLTYRIAGELPGLARTAFAAAVKQAFKLWSDVCGLPEFKEVQSGGNVVITTGRIDGKSGTLAWSMLPPADPAEQRYDVDEPWGRGIDLVAVLAHEIGHALGLQHASQNAKALMAPYYSDAVTTPQPHDVARIRALYGDPEPVDVPAPPKGEEVNLTLKLWNCDGVTVTPGPDGLTTIEFRGVDKAELPGYTVKRVA